MKKTIFAVGAILLVLLTAACGSSEPAEPVTLTLMTHDSFEISEETISAFTEESGIEVQILKSGDGGEMVNKAILSKDTPLADVMFGVDNTFLSRALDNDIFVAYDSPVLADVDASLQLDSENRALPVDYGDVCLNYDKAWFAESELNPPTGLDDLIDPAYASLTVVQNPATSTPGLAFLLATVDYFGEDGYIAYWEQLLDNDVLVTSGWEDAYWGQFSGASDGTRPIVVSYASSPPAEVLFAAEPIDEAPTAAVVSDGSCFRQIEFAGILNGTDHEEEAQQLIDFMLSPTFQADIPLNMFVYPANNTVALPEVFAEHSLIPDNPAVLDPSAITENRESWIDAWTTTVLR